MNLSDFLEAAWGLYRWLAVGLFTLWWIANLYAELRGRWLVRRRLNRLRAAARRSVMRAQARGSEELDPDDLRDLYDRTVNLLDIAGRRQWN